MSRLTSLLSCAGLALALACDRSSPATARKVQDTPRPDPAGKPDPVASPDPDREAARLAPSQSAFAFDLYRGVAAAPGNLALSPTSLSLALAMARAGAAGETRAE